MANVYVRSGAGGAGTGADWANAYTTLAAALNAKSAGDAFWVSEDHAESTAGAVVLLSPGTPTSPCTIVCVNHAGSVPPVSADLRTTATVSTTGSSDIHHSGYVSLCYGIHFSAGGGGANNATIRLYDANAAFTHFWQLQNCILEIASTVTNSNGGIILGGSVGGNECHWRWINTTLKFGSTFQVIIPRSRGFLEWFATSSAIDGSGSIPTNLFDGDADYNGSCQVFITGVDLSALSTGTNLFYSGQGGQRSSQYTLTGCKLGSAVTVSGSVNQREAFVRLIDCDSAGTNYRTEQYCASGQQTVETTIVRTGGATDGTTPISWKIATNSASSWLLPYESIPMAIWNDTTAANRTVTVYGVWGGGAVPNNDDIWIEASYMGSASTPIATINTANTKADFLASGSAQGSDSSTWGGSTTKFKMSVTLSSPQPAQKGPIYVTVKAAAASSTFYIDPKIVLS